MNVLNHFIVFNTNGTVFKFSNFYISTLAYY